MSTAVDAQTLAVVDMAITEVRMDIFDAITPTRALEIAGYSDAAAPSTANENLRATAKIVEVLLTTAKLVEQLPAMFLQDAAKFRDDFNDEPLTRDSAAIRKYKSDLYIRASRLMGRLQSPEQVTGNGAVFSCGAVDADGNDDPYLYKDHFIGVTIP